MINKNEIISTVKPEIVLGQIYHTRDTLQIIHHQTLSFAEHKASEEYYDGIVGLADELIEAYFGCMGKRLNYKIPASEYTSPIPYLTNFKEYLMKHRNVFGMDRTHLQNIIDEIIALVTKTLYLLSLS